MMKKERIILKRNCGLFAINLKQSDEESRISQILEGMQRWYRELPQISKNLKNHMPILNRIMQIFYY